MSQVQKEFIYLLGKKFLKITKPDSICWFTKVTHKTTLGIAWSTKKGDYWYDKIPGDKRVIWKNKRKLKNVNVYELYIGPLMVGIAKANKLTAKIYMLRPRRVCK